MAVATALKASAYRGSALDVGSIRSSAENASSRLCSARPGAARAAPPAALAGTEAIGELRRLRQRLLGAGARALQAGEDASRPLGQALALVDQRVRAVLALRIPRSIRPVPLVRRPTPREARAAPSRQAIRTARTARRAVAQAIHAVIHAPGPVLQAPGRLLTLVQLSPGRLDLVGHASQPPRLIGDPARPEHGAHAVDLLDPALPVLECVQVVLDRPSSRHRPPPRPGRAPPSRPQSALEGLEVGPLARARGEVARVRRAAAQGERGSTEGQQAHAHDDPHHGAAADAQRERGGPAPAAAPAERPAIHPAAEQRERRR